MNLTAIAINVKYLFKHQVVVIDYSRNQLPENHINQNLLTFCCQCWSSGIGKRFSNRKEKKYFPLMRCLNPILQRTTYPLTSRLIYRGSSQNTRTCTYVCMYLPTYLPTYRQAYRQIYTDKQAHRGWKDNMTLLFGTTYDHKQRFLTPGHQGWNDLHSLCRIGMEYYLLNNDDNNIIYWITMIIIIMMMIIIMMTIMIIGTTTIMIMIIIITTTLTMTIMKMIMIETAQTPCQSLYQDRRI